MQVYTHTHIYILCCFPLLGFDVESFCHKRHFTHFKWGFTCPWLLLHLQNIKPLYAYHVSCQIPMLMKGVISNQSQNCYFPSQCAKEKGPNNNPEIHHVQTQFCFYTTRIADWHIYLRIRYISSRIARPTNATQMWQVFLFYSLTLIKQRSPKQTKWVFANRNPKKEILIFYFWTHNQEAYYNLILSLLRSIHLIEILPFRNWNFAVANHKVVGTLFDCYMCVLGSKQTTKTFSTDMMTWWHFPDLNGVTIPLMRNKKSPFSWLRKPEQD